LDQAQIVQQLPFYDSFETNSNYLMAFWTKKTREQTSFGKAVLSNNILEGNEGNRLLQKGQQNWCDSLF
jgi:hypothetical protein